MERNIRLNWEAIVRDARRRRKERGLTQQHLAALANVGRSTVVRFENEKADITLSSVLRILGVLDMLDRKQEGTLLVKRNEGEKIGFVAMFAPNFGSRVMEPKAFADERSLNAFLEALGVTVEARKRTIADLTLTGSATVPRVALSQVELQEYWPVRYGGGS